MSFRLGLIADGKEAADLGAGEEVEEWFHAALFR